MDFNFEIYAEFVGYSGEVVPGDFITSNPVSCSIIQKVVKRSRSTLNPYKVILDWLFSLRIKIKHKTVIYSFRCDPISPISES